MAHSRKSRARSSRYRLRAELADLSPPIWRRIWVEGGMTLGELHHILQAAMGWTDAHLHEFAIAGDRYGIPDHENDPNLPVEDERRIKLHAVLSTGLEFQYEYDFVDGWVHLVRVEQTAPQDDVLGVAYVEGGQRACPPEDCGGAQGYQDFLDELQSDPQAEDVLTFLKWAGNDFDLERYERRAANAALLRLAWNQWDRK